MRLDVDGTSIASHEWYAEERTGTILFWHGLGATASGAEMIEVAPRLAAAGFDVIAIDAPGFGSSHALPPAGYHLAALAEIMLRVIENRELHKPVLMGHSWGAFVAARFAASFPDLPRAVVLVEGGHLDLVDLPQIDESMTLDAWIAREKNECGEWESKEALEAWRRERIHRYTPELLAGQIAGARRVESGFVGTPSEVRGAAMYGLVDRVSGGWHILGEKRIPTLLVLATEPPFGEQNRRHLPAFQAAVPQAEVWWATGAGHDVLADMGPRIGDDVALWLHANS